MTQNYRSKWKSAGAAIALIMGLAVSPAARPDVIYDFSGIFDGGTVAGVLRLADSYAPGASLAESSFGGATYFLSYEQSLTGYADLLINGTSFLLVAGGPDTLNFIPAAGDGALPGAGGVPSLADIYVVDESGSLGINDFSMAGGTFFVSNGGGVFTGSEGHWTLRETSQATDSGALIPEPGTVALVALCLGSLAWARRRNSRGQTSPTTT